MAEKKHMSYFDYSDVERQVKKRLEQVPEENSTNSIASLKKLLYVTQTYYMNAMDSLEALKKSDKANERKIEKIQKDVKSIYLLSAVIFKHLNDDTRRNLDRIKNAGEKQD